MLKLKKADKSTLLRGSVALLAPVFIINGACGRQTGTIEQATETIGEHDVSIAWFEGDTDTAFAFACQFY